LNNKYLYFNGEGCGLTDPGVSHEPDGPISAAGVVDPKLVEVQPQVLRLLRYASVAQDDKFVGKDDRFGLMRTFETLP
jgi:hypothetical protein